MPWVKLSQVPMYSFLACHILTTFYPATVPDLKTAAEKLIPPLHEIAQANEMTLSKLNLAGAQLNMIDLNGAYLKGADFFTADLKGANLSRADLANANLSRANMEFSNLKEANLEGAELLGA